MDRTLKVFAKTGHLFAEYIFNYDQPNSVSVTYTQYRRLYDDGEEDESKSVFPLITFTSHLHYKKFTDIAQIKQHDETVVKDTLGREMTAPSDYKYVYDSATILQRYLIANHIHVIGMVNVLYSFIDNKKEVKFLSGHHPRFDMEIEASSFETNLECISRIPMYLGRGEYHFHYNDLTKLPVWY